jgi:terminase large subunit-like protein
MPLFAKGNKFANGQHHSRLNKEKEAIKGLWDIGRLAYKFKTRPLLAKIRAEWVKSTRVSRKFAIISSRRTGKSSLGLLLLTERAIKFPGTDHLYVAPVKNKLDLYIDPIFKDLFNDCPERLKPLFKRSKSILVFPNGSRIILVGSNRETYESSIRSFKLKTIFIDEAREIDDFQDMIESAALPSVFDSDGYIIISSTPSRTLDHYLKTVQEQLSKIGACFHSTIHEVGYPPERILEFEREMCGRNCTGQMKHSPSWRREYLAEWVKDETILLIPEFDEKKHVKSIPKDPLLFPFYHKFEAMDQGGVHKTVVLFAYFRFGKTPSLIVDGEEVFVGTDVRVDIIAKRIKERERLCNFGTVYSRMADVNDRIAVRSLNSMYGFDFNIVKKIYGENNTGEKGLKAMVQEARVWFKGSEPSIVISPNCVELIGALSNCVWDQNDHFAMSRTYGHADAIAALIYLLRHVPTQSPFPSNWRGNAPNEFTEEMLLGKKVDSDLQALQESFGFLSELEHRSY